MLCFRIPHVVWMKTIVSQQGAMHFSCAASAAHFLFLQHLNISTSQQKGASPCSSPAPNAANKSPPKPAPAPTAAISPSIAVSPALSIICRWRAIPTTPAALPTACAPPSWTICRGHLLSLSRQRTPTTTRRFCRPCNSFHPKIYAPQQGLAKSRGVF